MKPAALRELARDLTLLGRRQFVAFGLTALSGCASSLIRGQTPDPEDLLTEEDPEAATKLIEDVASTWGLTDLKIESVGLVTGLAGTGSDPPPGPQRQRLIDEMQTHGVPQPGKMLASDTTSLVLVVGKLPPGVRKGERFDLEVQIPRVSDTASLRSGWLMPSRLRQLEAMGATIHEGHVIGMAEGRVLVNAAFREGNPKVLETRGVIPGGGVSNTSRNVGLVLKDGHQSAQTAALIGNVINNRFYSYEGGRRAGMATAKRDNFVEIVPHKQYRHNLKRYLRVIRSIALRETPRERIERLSLLELKLLEPTTSASAALHLEAIGKEGVSVLKKGLESRDIEVRFNAAEALAYIGDNDTSAAHMAEAAQALGDAAKTQPSFRWGALNALVLIEHPRAMDVLTDLLHVPSIETRYGAFRALRTRNAVDPLVRGESLGDHEFRLHIINSTAEPVVHFARSNAPEIVLFNAEQHLDPPPFLFVNKRIMVKRLDDGRVKVSRFEPGKEDAGEVSGTQLSQLIPALVRMGAGYLDILETLRKAKKDGHLESRVAVDALPRQGRAYYRDDQSAEGTAEDGAESHEGQPFDADDEGGDLITGDRKRVAEIDFNKEEPKTWRRYLPNWKMLRAETKTESE